MLLNYFVILLRSDGDILKRRFAADIKDIGCYITADIHLIAIAAEILDIGCYSSRYQGYRLLLKADILDIGCKRIFAHISESSQ